MEGIAQEVEVHGNAVQADPRVRVSRRLDRASITMNSEKVLHFPIPTPTIVNGRRLKAGKVFIRFKTYEGSIASRISAIKVFDGDQLLFHHDVDIKATEVRNTSFEFPRRDVEWGCNVTLEVGDQGGNAAIDIIGVGIVFY